MRLGKLPLALASAMFAASTTILAAEPFSFRGIMLGTNLPDLRRMVFPEAPGARVVCSHDAEADSIRPTAQFTGSNEDASLGAVVCAAFVFDKALGANSTVLPPEWILARLKLGAIDVMPIYWFIPSSGSDSETDAHLYRISMRSNTAFWAETRAAFVRRYGKPTSVDKGTIPSVFTGRLDNETVVWANDESTITLVKRSEQPNRMTMVYEHKTFTPRAVDASPSDPAPATEAPAAPSENPVTPPAAPRATEPR